MTITSYTIPSPPAVTRELSPGGSDGSLAEITDVCGEGLDLLLAQYQDSPRLKSLLCAFLNQIQLLETATYNVSENVLSIETAEGVQLDLLGEIIGEGRDGQTDDEYRDDLRVRVLVNKSNGTREEMIAIVRLFENMDDETGAYVSVNETQPAGFEIRVFTTVLENPAVEIDYRVQEAKAAGVGATTIVHYGGVSDNFTFIRAADYAEKNTTMGFEYAGGGTVAGGPLAHIPSPKQNVVWTPEYLYPEAWFDASDLALSDTDPVPLWANKGTLGIVADMSQATGANQPTFNLANSAFSNQPTITLDGVNDSLSSAASTWWQLGASDELTVAGVVSVPASFVGSIVECGYDPTIGAGSSFIELRTTTPGFVGGSVRDVLFRASSAGDPNTTVTEDVPHVIFFRATRSGSNMITNMWIDGVALGASGSNTFSNQVAAGRDFSIGPTNGGAVQAMTWAELIYTKSAIGDTQRDLLYTFFNSKYGTSA